MGLSELGRFLMISGSIIFIVGAILSLQDLFPQGRFIGDFVFRKGFVLPVTTCLLVSVVITLVVNFFSK